jgi:hypothetical protein
VRKPTPEQFAAFQAQFEFFNAELFGGELAPVLLNFSRKAGAAGFFAPERWERGDEGEAGRGMHEISINPECLQRPPRETAQTLVHEMVHQWQRDFGKPSRAGYHNREWAQKMRDVGLEPVSLDSKDGTGQRVSDEVIEGGRFARAFERMPAECRIPYKCRPEPEGRGKGGGGGGNGSGNRNKVKYSCPSCEANVWGKPGLKIGCEDCDESFEEQEGRTGPSGL